MNLITKSPILKTLWLLFILICSLYGTLNAQLTRLTHESLTNNGHFGKELFISASTILVGEPEFTVSKTHVGRVHIFSRNGDSWEHTGFINAPVEEPFIHFGSAISFDDQHLAISAPDLQYGSVYLYTFDGAQWNLNQEIKLPVEHHQNHVSMRFGENVKLYENWLAITAPGYSSIDDEIIRIGAIFVYHFDGLTWEFVQKITPPDAITPGMFGEDIEITAGLLSVSAPKGNGGAAKSGIVYLYKLDGGIWVPEFTFINPDSRPHELFGSDVALSEDIIVIGVPMYTDDPTEGPKGAAHIFQRINSNWVSTAMLQPSDGKRNDMFGSAVEVEDGYVCVGAPRFDRPNMADVGKVYVFELDNGFWTEANSFMPPSKDLQHHMQFGTVLHLDQNQLVIGSYLMDNVQEDSGIAYETELKQTVGTEPSLIISSEVSLQPNPASDVLNIRFQADWKTGTSITIYAADGKPVFTQNVDAPFVTEINVPISTLSSGTYFLYVTDGKKISIQKWIKA